MGLREHATRVVITGIGVICPLGSTPGEVWQALQVGRSGIGPLRGIPVDALPVSFGAEAAQFSGAAEDFGPLDKQMTRTVRKATKVMCREIQMGVAAGQLALADAGLVPANRDPDRTGIIYGADYIMTTPDEFVLGIRACLGPDGRFDFGRWARDGMTKVDPLWLLKYLPNMPASHLAILNDLRGPNNSLTLREAGANLAVGEAYATLVRGHADAMIAGATGTRIHPVRSVHVALQETLATGEDPPSLCRPFDKHRTGMVLGEGAAAIVLETAAHAEARSARILAEVLGHASSTVMRQNGDDCRAAACRNALALALDHAGKRPGDIGHLQAHGLGTPDSDHHEARGISDVFGARSVPVMAAKSYFGNLGAGGGMVELICSLLTLQHDRLVPVRNFVTPDPACPVNVVRELVEPAGDCFVNLSLTPQGQASAVVVQRWR